MNIDRIPGNRCPEFAKQLFILSVAIAVSALGPDVWSAPRPDTINVRAAGARGDGTTDDTKAIQQGIDRARTNHAALLFPPGAYRITSPLNWGRWIGMHVTGGEPGCACIGGAVGAVKIVADGIDTVAHDFGGSSYGRVEGIAFAFTGRRPKVMVLLTHTEGGNAENYGCDLVFQNCNFSGGSVAGVVSHGAEVLTFRDCRFHCPGSPGLLITWRADMKPWNIKSPFYTLWKDVSVTEFRVFGGEFTGDNAHFITVDSPRYGCGDIAISGTYFATSGKNVAAVKLMGDGPVQNFTLTGIRCEETQIGGQNGLVFMDGVSLAHFQIHGRAVGAAGPVVFGKGNLVAGTIISEGGIRLDGNVTCVTYTSSNPLNLELGGNAIQFTARTPALGKVAVKGSVDMDDGQGGWIVFREPLFEAGSKTYTFDGRPGLYSATCGGDRILFQVSTAGGKTAAQAIHFLDQSKLTGNAGTGQLAFDNKGITATFVGTGDWFTVRRLGL